VSENIVVKNDMDIIKALEFGLNEKKENVKEGLLIVVTVDFLD
jgi:hypothetical protein